MNDKTASFVPAAVLATAFLALLALPSHAAAQQTGASGMKFEASGLWTTLVGGAFPHGESGLGVGLQGRYLWPSGVSAGVGALFAEPEDLSLPGDDRRRTMEQGALFGELRYSLSTAAALRPYVGARVGATTLKAEHISAADGTGILYGLVAGTEVWPSDRVGMHLGAVGGGLDVSGFFPTDANAAQWTVEAGLTVFLGDLRRDTDGDGVRDERDRCADTPGRVSVGADGCPVDEDADGVSDFRDACLDTPEGVRVDSRGCPLDSDHDGVPDGRDRCDGTSRIAPVDGEGCPLDDDGDGVHNAADECPETPAGSTVEEDGCRPDADGDGVPDEEDLCSGTAPRDQVDEAGCSNVQARLAEGKAVLPGLPFDYNAISLRSEARDYVEDIGRLLNRDPSLRLQIRVHTDDVGPAQQNLRLSQELAESVKEFIRRRYPEIASGRLEAVGVGEAEPVARNDTPEGRLQNRRVEFVVVGGGEDGGGNGGADGP